MGRFGSTTRRPGRAGGVRRRPWHIRTMAPLTGGTCPLGDCHAVSRPTRALWRRGAPRRSRPPAGAPATRAPHGASGPSRRRRPAPLPNTRDPGSQRTEPPAWTKIAAGVIAAAVTITGSSSPAAAAPASRTPMRPPLGADLVCPRTHGYIASAGEAPRQAILLGRFGVSGRALGCRQRRPEAHSCGPREWDCASSPTGRCGSSRS